MVSGIYVAVGFIPRTVISVMLEDNVLVLWPRFIHENKIIFYV